MNDTLVEYEGGLRCTARYPDSEVVVTTNAPKENHGAGGSFSPSDLFSVSLGSCILSTMAIAARSMNIDLAGSTAAVHKIMANAPRRINTMKVVVHIPCAVTDTQRLELEASAHSCPIHSLLNIDAPIAFRWGSDSATAASGNDAAFSNDISSDQHSLRHEPRSHRSSPAKGCRPAASAVQTTLPARLSRSEEPRP